MIRMAGRRGLPVTRYRNAARRGPGPVPGPSHSFYTLGYFMKKSLSGQPPDRLETV